MEYIVRSKFYMSFHHPVMKPIDKVWRMIDRIFRDNPPYRVEFLEVGLKLCKRYSGNVPNTFRALESRTHYGRYSNGGFELFRWDHIADEGLGYTSIRSREGFCPVQDGINRAIEQTFEQINGLKLDHTRINKCRLCSSFYKVGKRTVISHCYEYFSEYHPYDYNECPSCKGKGVHIRKKEKDLNECRRLMRDIKKTIKESNNEKHKRVA